MIGTIILMAFAGYGVCTLLLKIAEAFQGRKAAKEQEVELRKYCMGRYPDPYGCLTSRMIYAERLYRYLATGTAEPKEEEVEQ